MDKGDIPVIEKSLASDEGKTLEFKGNCRPLHAIVRTVVAFANTSGGSIVIGVKDKTKDVVGITEPLSDEERLANAFADSISPLPSRTSKSMPGGIAS